MAGVKGKGGRKSWDKEKDLKELWNVSTKILMNALNDPEITKLRKIEISQALVLKMCPQELKHGNKDGEPLVIRWES